MTRQDLQAAAAHLRQSERGRDALEAIRKALPDLMGLDEGNHAALIVLLEGLGEYDGTVLELLEDWPPEVEADTTFEER